MVSSSAKFIVRVCLSGQCSVPDLKIIIVIITWKLTIGDINNESHYNFGGTPTIY